MGRGHAKYRALARDGRGALRRPSNLAVRSRQRRQDTPAQLSSRATASGTPARLRAAEGQLRNEIVVCVVDTSTRRTAEDALLAAARERPSGSADQHPPLRSGRLRGQNFAGRPISPRSTPARIYYAIPSCSRLDGPHSEEPLALPTGRAKLTMNGLADLSPPATAVRCLAFDGERRRAALGRNPPACLVWRSSGIMSADFASGKYAFVLPCRSAIPFVFESRRPQPSHMKAAIDPLGISARCRSINP